MLSLQKHSDRATLIADCWKEWHGTDMAQYYMGGNMPAMTPACFVEFILYCFSREEERRAPAPYFSPNMMVEEVLIPAAPTS